MNTSPAPRGIAGAARPDTIATATAQPHLRHAPLRVVLPCCRVAPRTPEGGTSR